MSQHLADDRKPVGDWATDFDHFDPRYVNDANSVWRELRERCPVAKSPRYGGMTILARFDDVVAVASDPAQFSSRRVIVSEATTERPGLTLPAINIDPPDHARSRRVFLAYLSRGASEEWRNPIRQVCLGRLKPLVGRTEFDAATDYAQGIPTDITAMVLGVDPAETPQFQVWVHELMELGPAQPDVARQATREILDYMRQKVSARRASEASGGADIITYLFEQTVEGRPLEDEEIVKILFLILTAGVDTTWSALASAIYHLAEHPDDRQRLLDDPSLARSFTEEVLRYYTPTFAARIANDDTEISGCPVSKDEWVVMAFASANRDPTAFDEPETFVIDRTHNNHVAFGVGIHKCPGLHLARIEVATAVMLFVEQFPHFRLAEGAELMFPTGQVRGPRSVPIEIL